MPHRHGLRSALLRGLVPALALLGAGACDSDKLKGPAAEVKKSDIKPNLPAVPGFELPPPNPDGSKSVKEMRVKGKKLLDNDITVKGVVTWVYDCKTRAWAQRFPKLGPAPRGGHTLAWLPRSGKVNATAGPTTGRDGSAGTGQSSACCPVRETAASA